MSNSVAPHDDWARSFLAATLHQSLNHLAVVSGAQRPVRHEDLVSFSQKSERGSGKVIIVLGDVHYQLQHDQRALSMTMVTRWCVERTAMTVRAAPQPAWPRPKLTEDTSTTLVCQTAFPSPPPGPSPGQNCAALDSSLLQGQGIPSCQRIHYCPLMSLTSTMSHRSVSSLSPFLF